MIFGAVPAASMDEAETLLLRAHSALPTFKRNALALANHYGSRGRREDARRWANVCSAMEQEAGDATDYGPLTQKWK